MNAFDLMAKSHQAASSSFSLLCDGDTDGACNRAYYSMFDAARAALIEAGQPIGKTHKGVLAKFSEQFVKTGIVPEEVGRSLKKAETFRYVADYDSASVHPDDAKELVALAQEFFGIVQSKLLQRSPVVESSPKG